MSKTHSFIQFQSKTATRRVKWQTEPFTDKILRQLQEEPKVILESGSVHQTQTDHSVPDLSNVANFVECPLNEEDIYINLSVSRDDNEDTSVSDVAVKRDEAVQDIEETLLKMFEDGLQSPRKSIVKPRKIKKSKRKENLKDILIRLFGSVLDDLDSPEKVEPKQERKNFYTPSKIQMDRRHTLPVSIKFDDDTLKPLKVNQKRRSEGDLEIVPAKKLQIEELNARTEILTVEYSTVVDLVVPPVYTETLKIVDLANLSKATVMVTPSIQQACQIIQALNKPPAVIDLTQEDSSDFFISREFNSFRIEFKKEQRVESEQAHVPATCSAPSMPLLSPVSPAVPTQSEAVLPQATSQSCVGMEQFQAQRFQSGLTIEPVQAQRPQEPVQSNLTIEPVNQTSVIIQPVQTQRPPPPYISPMQQEKTHWKSKQKSRRQSKEESPLQQKKKSPQQKKAAANYQSQMSGASVQHQQQMAQQQQPMAQAQQQQPVVQQQQQQMRRLSHSALEEMAKLEALTKKAGPDPKNYLPQSHMFQMHASMLAGQHPTLLNYLMAQKQPPPNVSVAPSQQQPGAGHQQWANSNYQPQQNNQQLSPPAMSRLYPLQAPRLGYQVLSNATCAEKIFPYMYKALKWRSSPNKFLNEMTTFLDVYDWKDEKAHFVDFVQKRIKVCSEKMVKDLSRVVVESFSLGDILCLLVKMFEEKKISVNVFAVCNFLYAFMLQPVEQQCSTPFLKRFYTTIKLSVERMEEKSKAAEVLFSPTQLQLLKTQIQHFWRFQNWLNACARREAAQKTNARNTTPTTRIVQPNTAQPPNQESNVQARSNSTLARPESLPLPQAPVHSESSTRPPERSPRVDSLFANIPRCSVIRQQVPETTQQTTENATCNKPKEVPVSATAEDAVSTTIKDETKTDEVVDLTWIDDGDENEIMEKIIESKAFKFKLEILGENEVEPSPREVISPTDSGLGSPGATQNDDGGFKCLCGNRAIYVCACNSSMYCSSDCQNKDWMYHQKLCHKMKS